MIWSSGCLILNALVNRTTTGKWETQVCRKSTHTDRYNYSNSNSILYKKSCIQTSFKGAITHSSTPALKKIEEEYLMKIFQKKTYSRNFIIRQLPPTQPTKSKALNEKNKENRPTIYKEYFWNHHKIIQTFWNWYRPRQYQQSHFTWLLYVNHRTQQQKKTRPTTSTR